MEYFPDIAQFNIDTCAGKVQYLAHCDLEPVLFLIEQTKISTNSALDFLGQKVRESDTENNFLESSGYLNRMAIFSSKVVPLAYQSILLIIFSLFEEALKTWCRMLYIENDQIEKYTDFKKTEFKKSEKIGELEKAILYVEKYSYIKNITSHESWNKIRAIRVVRNAIVHNNGRIETKKRKYLDKYNFGTREEDHCVYIDYDTIIDMYFTIMNFLDNIFFEGVSLETKGKTDGRNEFKTNN